MAHIAKYKATSVGHMLAHYRRDASSMERDNIDPKRVKNDMVVAHYTNKDGKLVVGRVVPREGEPNWGTVERRIERVNEAQKAAGKRATRKDAVVMADVVVTLPDNVRKGDEDRFFRLTYWYLSNKFGIDNMMGGYVHKDEVLKDGTPARDHMHAPFTPILDGRFNYKKMCPRSFYQSMHKELGDYLKGVLATAQRSSLARIRGRGACTPTSRWTSTRCAMPWTRPLWSLRSRKPSESSRRLRRKPPLCLKKPRRARPSLWRRSPTGKATWPS